MNLIKKYKNLIMYKTYFFTQNLLGQESGRSCNKYHGSATDNCFCDSQSINRYFLGKLLKVIENRVIIHSSGYC